MGFTNSLNKDVLNHVFRNIPLSSPSKVYVALFTSSTKEVSGGEYERMEITFGSPANNKLTNSEEVRFKLATDDWGKITHGAIFDSKAGGKQLDLAEIGSHRDVRKNDQFIIGKGNYTIELG